MAWGWTQDQKDKPDETPPGAARKMVRKDKPLRKALKQRDQVRDLDPTVEFEDE